MWSFRNTYFLFFILATAGCRYDSISPITSTWKPVPMIYGKEDQLMEDIYFMDESTGYILGDMLSAYPRTTLLKTTDGGVTWIVDTIRVDYFNAQKILGYYGGSLYLMGDIVTISNPNRIIYKTSDEGKTWERDSTTADFLIDETNQLRLQSGIEISHDGGKTWKQVYPDYTPSEVKFTSSQVGYAVGGGYFYDEFPPYGIVGNVGFMLKTIDGGESWKNLNVRNDFITSINFLNNEIGYVTTIDGVLSKTTNGGKDWTVINSHLQVPSISFFNSESEAYAVGQGSILHSLDEGKTWINEYGNSLGQITRMYFYSSNIGFAIYDETGPKVWGAVLLKLSK